MPEDYFDSSLFLLQHRRNWSYKPLASFSTKFAVSKCVITANFIWPWNREFFSSDAPVGPQRLTVSDDVMSSAIAKVSGAECCHHILKKHEIVLWTPNIQTKIIFCSYKYYIWVLPRGILAPAGPVLARTQTLAQRVGKLLFLPASVGTRRLPFLSSDHYVKDIR